MTWSDAARRKSAEARRRKAKGKSLYPGEKVIDTTGWQEQARRAREHAAAMAELAAKDKAEDKRRGIKYPPRSGYRGGARTPNASDYPHHR